jgi:hypothetical protein
MYKSLFKTLIYFTSLILILSGCSTSKVEKLASEQTTITMQTSSTMNENVASEEQSTQDEPVKDVVISLKDRIHTTSSEFIFKVFGKKLKSEYYDFYKYSAYKIEIFESNGKEELVQEILFEATDTPDEENLGFVIEDMNFDGYKDIRIQQFLPAAPNIPYYCWLWDEKTSKFIENLYLEEITSPEFNQENKVIKSFARASSSNHFERTYKYLNGIPTLIEEYEIAAETKDDKTMIHHILREFKDGRMQVIQEYYEPYKDDK